MKKNNYRNYYPAYVFNINEDITRENMRKYDAKKKRYYDYIEEHYPNYYELPMRERMEIRDAVSEKLGFKP